MLALTLALGLAATPASPAKETVTFRFAWPESLAADVTHTRSKTRPGRPAEEISLRGRLTTELRGAELWVGFRDWKPTAPGAAKQLDPLLAAAGKVSTVVTRNGQFVRAEGIPQAVEAMRAQFREAPAEARPALERLEKMAPAMMTKEARETWSMLVEFWNGQEYELDEANELDGASPILALPGEQIRIVTRFQIDRRLPCPGRGGGCVQVRLRSQPDAKDVERVTKRFIAELGLPEAQVSSLMGEMAMTTDVVVVTDPTNLVPYRFEKTRTTRISPGPNAPADAKPMEGRDVSVWTFTYGSRKAK
jgi:hypothetical protein